MMDRLLRESYKASEALGHDWLGAEHLLVGLLETELAGQALHTCGLTREALLTDISRLPADYQRRRLNGVAAGIRVETADMKEVLARAEGMAAGLGSPVVQPEHVLLSLVWHPTSAVAVGLLESHGATQSRLVAALLNLGVKIPETPPPVRPKWGTSFSLSRDEFERLAADLRDAGVLYCFNYTDDAVRVSVEDKDPAPSIIRETLGDRPR
jgi:ATP-dependent Clp protease ATP-binding subunit ClpA